MEGCLEWQRRGLAPPTVITQSTEDYLADHDSIGMFINEDYRKDPDGRVAKGDFYHCYRVWTEAQGEKPVSARRLAENMRTRGFGEKKIQGERYWKGLKDSNVIHGRPNPEDKVLDEDDE